MNDLTLIPFKILDHTADVRITAAGRTIEDLFINAARGMFFLLCDKPPALKKKTVQKTVRFSGADNEMLLVAWLQELLYQYTEKRYYPIQYTSVSLKPPKGHARIQTLQLKRDDLRIKQDIKAVTYHQLCVTYERKIYNTTIIFDV